MGLTATELPESTKYLKLNSEKPARLEAGAWNNFGDLNIAVVTDAPKILFGFYSVSIVVAGN